MTGLAPAPVCVRAFFFFGLWLVGLGKTPTAGELNALPSPVAFSARFVSTVSPRRLRNSSDAGRALLVVDGDERKLNGCGRFLLDGGGVRSPSEPLRAVFLCGEEPSSTPDCPVDGLLEVPENDRFLESVGAGSTLESEPVRAMRCEPGRFRDDS